MFKVSWVPLASASLSVLSLCGVAGATEFVSQADSYTQGTVSLSHEVYDQPSACLGQPTGVTGVGSPYPGVVSVFNPPYDTDQIVLIGVGGSIQLQFPSPVVVGTGPAIGVFSNVGLEDSDYPNGVVADPLVPFGGGTADVSVSQDGTNWVSLGTVDFDNPENYYLNAGPYDAGAPADPQVADFGQPFTGSVNEFAGEDNAQVLSTLDGSAGGTWLDLSGTGLSQVDYIQFSIPGNAPSGSQLALSAVSVAESHEVPEPASLSLIAAGGLLALARRRRTTIS